MQIRCRFTLRITFSFNKIKPQRSPRLADIVNKSGTAGESNPGDGSKEKGVESTGATTFVI